MLFDVIIESTKRQLLAGLEEGPSVSVLSKKRKVKTLVYKTFERCRGASKKFQGSSEKVFTRWLNTSLHVPPIKLHSGKVKEEKTTPTYKTQLSSAISPNMFSCLACSHSTVAHVLSKPLFDTSIFAVHLSEVASIRSKYDYKQQL